MLKHKFPNTNFGSCYLGPFTVDMLGLFQFVNRCFSRPFCNAFTFKFNVLSRIILIWGFITVIASMAAGAAIFPNLSSKPFRLSILSGYPRVCRAPFYRLNALTDSSDLNSNFSTIFSTADIEGYARQSGINIVSKITAGTYLRLEAYPIGSSQIIGYLSAFIRPGIFHLDTIQVQNRRQLLAFKRQGWKIDGPGMSFLMGSWALCWANEKGLKKAQLLAVNDTETMHKILVRLYSSFGFKTLRVVGEGISSISDRLVWGAVGTLMELDIENFFEEWDPKFKEFAKTST